MYEKINYTAVGIFVLLFSALSFYFAFWLAKGNITKDNFNIYYTYFNESVDGLTKDSVVKLNGVDIGRLEKLTIDTNNQSRIVATLYIRKNIKITKDMYVVLKSQGVTGLRYINIVGGTSKEIIKPNTKESIIKSKKSFMSKLLLDTPMLLSKLTQFSDNLNILLNSKNLDNVNKILINTNEITKKTIVLEDNINTILKEFNTTNISNILQDVNITLNKYKILANSGNKTIYILNKRLPGLFSSIQNSANKLGKTSYLIEKTVKRGDYNLKRILRPAVIDLKELSISYIELANELKSLIENPTGAIFNGVSMPKGPGE